MGRIESDAPRHPIGLVARRTGLKPDLIRAWERRYHAVAPGRSTTRRRFYSDDDIERLLLLRRVVRTGRGIGQVAGLPNEDLLALLAEEGVEPAADGAAASLAAAPLPLPEPASEVAAGFLQLCVAAAHRLDAGELEALIERASVALSRVHLLDRLFVPLLHKIGDLWHDGTLRPAHEHLVSAAVRTFLGTTHAAWSTHAGAPQLVVTTPARQHHELGALIVAAAAAGEGWSVTYLGPDLPPEDVAAAAFQLGATAVAVSITYPPDDPLLADDLRRLRRLLPPTTALLAGGRSAAAYGAVLEEIGAAVPGDLAGLRARLAGLRRGGNAAPA